MSNAENTHSEGTVSVHSKETNQRMKIIEHIPDALVKVVHGIVLDWKVLQVMGNIDEKHWGTPEGKWIPCNFSGLG